MKWTFAPERMLSRDFSWQDFCFFFNLSFSNARGTCNPHSGAKFSPSSGLSPIKEFSFFMIFLHHKNTWCSPTPQSWQQMGQPQILACPSKTWNKEKVNEVDIHLEIDTYYLNSMRNASIDANGKWRLRSRSTSLKYKKTLVVTALFSGMHPKKSRCCKVNK